MPILQYHSDKAILEYEGQRYELINPTGLPTQGSEELDEFAVSMDDDNRFAEFVECHGKMFRLKRLQSGGNRAGQRRQGYRQDRRVTQGQSNQRFHKQDEEYRKNQATSPYNFVPLPSDDEVILLDNRMEGNLSGHIQMEIENLTHLFVGSDKGKNFMIGDSLAIPGSSIRGMIRQLSEIISFGKFTHFNARKRLYIRNFAMKNSDAKDYYIERTKSDDSRKPIKIGFLNYDRHAKQFYILECQDQEFEMKAKRIRENGKTFQYRIEGSHINLYSGPMPNKGKAKKHWKILNEISSDHKHYIPIEVVQDYHSDSSRKASGDMKNILAKAKRNGNQNADQARVFKHGVPIFYSMEGDEVKSFGHTRYYRIPYHLTIGDHVSDKLQSEDKIDLVESLFGTINQSKAVPGKLQITDAVGPPKAGHTEESLLQILSNPRPTSYQLYLDQSGVRDFKDLRHWGMEDANIRGYKQYWQRHTNQSKTLNWRKSRFRIIEFEKMFKLKRNAYQSYVKENSDLFRIEDARKKADIRIAFNKPFSQMPDSIQQQIRDAMANAKEHTFQFKKVHAVQPGNTFAGSRIYFDKLSKEELGLLLSALQLPEDCYHRLGGGKPLGMGVVQLKYKLFLTDRKERYTSVLAEKQWAEATQAEVDPDTYIKSFEKFLESNGVKLPFWTTHDRMKSLKAILTFKKDNMAENDWLQGTKYQKLDKFRKRYILPTALDIAEKHKI